MAVILLFKCMEYKKINLILFLLIISLLLFCVKCEKYKESVKLDTFNFISNYVISPEKILPTNSTNKLCAEDSKLLLKEAKLFNVKALQVLDSWGKIPSGILNGNINQFGDFDECIGVKGRYCLLSASFTLRPQLDPLIFSHYAIRSNITDSGHRVPRFSTVHWGLCIPSTCTSSDLETAVNNYLKSNKLLSNVVAKLESKMCQAIEDKSPITKFSFFVAVLFFGLIFLLCLIATLLEPILMKRSSSDNLLVSFSFYKNWKILMNTNQNPNDITSIDGIRFMSAVSLLLSHKQMALMFLPYINRTHMAEITGVAWTTIGRTAILHTDTFIFLSGFLSAKSLFADLEKSNKIYLKQSVISRFIRLTPNLFAVIIFSTWILPNVNWGPLWPQVITTHSDLCKINFWRNLFYIHNFFPFEEMCLTHTHQLGIDMQLYLSSFLLIFLLWNFQKFGIILMIFIASVSTYFRYATTVTYNLSSIVHYGISISRLMKTANYSYIRPSHRMTVYIMGILLSYFLHIKKNKILLSKVQVFLGWILFLSFGLLTVVGPFSTGLIDYTYYAFDAAIYSSFAPILWCSFVSWGLITSHYGFAGWFGSFLSWKGFKIFTKISYAVYLTQFPIFFYNVGTKRTSSFYSPFDMFNIGELSCIIFVSVLLTLMFDIPFQNVQKILWPKNVEGLCARNSDKMINYNVYHDANREEEIAREVVTVRQRNIRSHG